MAETDALGVPADASDAEGTVDADTAVDPDVGPSDTPTETVAPLPVDDSRFFDPDRVPVVRVTLEPAAWDELRQQARSLTDVLGEDCLDSPANSPFTWFEADAVIDGFEVLTIGVRKKGFLGSLDPIYPSIKLKLDEYVDGQDLGGMTRMTLNNAKQDPSKVNQCITYALFSASGVPAPRCSYVRLYVNEKDMGLYVHVESIKKPFLRRHFPFDGGNLYEGALSDFRPDWVNTFSKKTNSSNPDRSDLDAVATAAQAPDATLLAELAAVIDLDRFYTMWAMEVLTNHQDGYAQNANNFYVYRGLDGRFTFIPWGTDATIQWSDSGIPFASVKANSRITRRLYQHPEGRAAYLERLQALLNTVWNEVDLLAQIDRQQALITPHVLASQQAALQTAMQDKRHFVQNHRGRIEAELISPPSWDFPERDSPCFEERGSVDITFSTTFGTLGEEDIFATGTATVDAVVDALPWLVPTVGSKAGVDPANPETTQIVVAGFLDEQTTPGGIFYALVVLPTDDLASGVSVAVNWAQAFGQVARLPEGSDEAELVGFMLGGTLTLDFASAVSGAPIQGRLQSPLIRQAQ